MMGNLNNARETSGDPPKQETQGDCDDPRSPSKGVSRTPLRLQGSRQTQLQQQQKFDPRSPSNCIDRTPIQITNLPQVQTRDTNETVKIALNYENMPPPI